MIKNCAIVYFTGTGGTKLAAQTLKEELDKAVIEASVLEIFREDMPNVEDYDTFVLMYPVYASDAPTPIYEWIDSLQNGKGKNAVIVSVSGGGEVSPNTACRIKPIAQLEKKGYKVECEYMLCMPANFIEATDMPLAAELIRVLPQKCEKIASDIKNGASHRIEPIGKDKVLRAVASMEKVGQKFFGKSLKADDSCISCGICEKGCPRGNIKMTEGKPVFGGNCVICTKCIYACPENSIKVRLPILKRMVLKDGFDLNDIIKHAKNSEKISDLSSYNTALWKGVKMYLEEQDGK